MEDDLNKNENGRNPICFLKNQNYDLKTNKRGPQKKWKKMKEILKRNGEKPKKLNGRRPQKNRRRPQKYNKNGTQPKKNKKWKTTSSTI